MARKAGFFDVEERLREVSTRGDERERPAALVDFALIRPELVTHARQKSRRPTKAEFSNAGFFPAGSASGAEKQIRISCADGRSSKAEICCCQI